MTTLQLEPKLMKALVVLCDRPGEVITPQELMDAVWSQTHVSESLVRRAVSELRRHLGDDAKNPSYIQTIAKKGYRIIAPIQPLTPLILPEKSAPISQKEPKRSGPKRNRTLGWFILGVGLLVSALWLTRPKTKPSPGVSSTITPAGSETRGWFRDLEAGPDGQWVAFSWDPNEGDQGNLYLAEKASGRIRLLSKMPQPQRFPIWTEDQTVVFTVNDGQSTALTRLQLPNGTPEAFLYLPCQVAGLDFYRKDRSLVMAHRPDAAHPFRLKTMALDTEKTTSLSDPPPHFLGDLVPQVSPDQHHIAFLRGPSRDEMDLFVISSDGGPARRLTFNHAPMGSIAWGPRSQWLYFTLAQDGQYQLWRLDPGGGEANRCKSLLQNTTEITVAMNGQFTVASHLTKTEIWRLNLQETNPRAKPWISGNARDTYPRVSPDGESILFASDRSGAPELWSCDASGDQLVKLSAFGGPFIGYPNWSPDGLKAVFEARVGGHSNLYWLHTQRGGSRQLTDDRFEDRFPFWSRDGHAIYFASNRKNGWQLWRLAFPNGQPEQVTPNGGYLAELTTEGHALLFTKREQSGLWHLDLTNLQEKRLEGFEAIELLAWTQSQEGLYFAQANEESIPTLFYQEHGRKNAIAICPLPGMPEKASITLDQTNKKLYFSTVERIESKLLTFDELHFE